MSQEEKKNHDKMSHEKSSGKIHGKNKENNVSTFLHHSLTEILTIEFSLF